MYYADSLILLKLFTTYTPLDVLLVFNLCPLMLKKQKRPSIAEGLFL